VRGIRIERDGVLEHARGLLVAAELEEHLPFERAVDRLVARGLERAAHEEHRPLEIVEIEERLGLQVVDLGLQAAIGPGQLGPTGKQLVAELQRQLELAQLLDQQLDAVQVRRRELRIGRTGGLELVERLVDAPLVPEDLSATVVRLGAIRVQPERLVEPGQRFVDPPAVRGLHRLVEAIPVAVLVVLHTGSCSLVG